MVDKNATIGAHKLHETDTGSPEVQIALLTARINELTEHLKIAQEGPPQPSWPADAWSAGVAACSTTCAASTSSATARSSQTNGLRR